MGNPHPRQTILVTYGTRPELIKLAPVIFALRSRPEAFEVVVCSTGQHRRMLEQVQNVFGITPDFDLDIMKPDQQLNELSSRVFSKIDGILRQVGPDWVLVQGDTTTVMITTLASFHLGFRVGHVEAGLRTGDFSAPFPEEANRSITDLMADLRFAPTARSRDILLAEGHEPASIFLTGNTVVDAVKWIAQKLPEEPEVDEVLITLHRRESFGEPLSQILAAIKELALRFPETRWVYPVHSNPNVRGPAHEMLGETGNILLCDPLPYDQLVRYMKRSRLVLTDSGGIQEEAPTFGKPILITRDKTERPEGVEIGAARLVGTRSETIIETVSRLLTDREEYSRMARVVSPYGDGLASERIADILGDRDSDELRPKIH